MFRYETHLHTAPVSRCAGASVERTLTFYSRLGYAGVFITNHFIDGNINIDRSLPYAEKLAFYRSDYDNAVKLGHELGISVFFGVEMTYDGTDFLVYGLSPEWYEAHPEIEGMKKSALLALLAENGALVIHAHPFHHNRFIDHIRLYPNLVHGVEIFNACRAPEANAMAELYAKHYGLIPFAGSDNHSAEERPMLAGMLSSEPIKDEADFVRRCKNGELEIFKLENPQKDQ